MVIAVRGLPDGTIRDLEMLGLGDHRMFSRPDGDFVAVLRDLDGMMRDRRAILVVAAPLVVLHAAQSFMSLSTQRDVDRNDGADDDG